MCYFTDPRIRQLLLGHFIHLRSTFLATQQREDGSPVFTLGASKGDCTWLRAPQSSQGKGAQNQGPEHTALTEGGELGHSGYARAAPVSLPTRSRSINK